MDGDTQIGAVNQSGRRAMTRERAQEGGGFITNAEVNGASVMFPS